MTVLYRSKRQHEEIASHVFGGDDTANQRSASETTAEEDAFDAVTVADQLNTLHQVQYETTQHRPSQVLSLELSCQQHKTPCNR